jgi:hypothetical protein
MYSSSRMARNRQCRHKQIPNQIRNRYHITGKYRMETLLWWKNIPRMAETTRRKHKYYNHQETRRLYMGSIISRNNTQKVHQPMGTEE